MTYQGWYPAGMPSTETTFTTPFPEIHGPATEGLEPEDRGSDAETAR